MTIDFPCVNCDGPIPWVRKKVYCTPFCREQAKHIRWVRSTIERGVWEDPEIAEARLIRIAHLNSGGYMPLGRRISIESRYAIYEKYNDLCASCGVNALNGEIDHISGSSNSLDNLQLLCSKCHREKTLANIHPIPEDSLRRKEIKILHDEIRARINSPKPIRDCDNHLSWSEKALEITKARRVEYHQHLLSFIQPLMIEKMNVKTIAKKLNDAKVSTYSGRGSWSRERVRELIADNGFTIEYSPRTHQSEYTPFQRDPL